jgi:predicted dienelactone hydrolase
MNLVPQGLTVAVVGVVAFACSSNDPRPAPTAQPSVTALTTRDVTERGPYAVGSATYELIDATRPTGASGDVPGSDRRLLITEVWYPAVADPARPDGREAAVDLSGGPYPLIVFAHGLSSSRLFSPQYVQHLASHGYVVAAPDFPLTRINTPGGTRFLDTVNQSGDVSYIIDEMLRFNETSDHLLEEAIDAEQIGLSGQSGGGFTTMFAVYGGPASSPDERIDAALPISSNACFIDDRAFDADTPPMMFIHGSEDLIIPRRGSAQAYRRARAPRYHVEILGANHVRFSLADIDDEVVAGRIDGLLGIENEDGTSEGTSSFAGCFGEAEPAGAAKLTLDEQQEALRLYATPFFDTYLKQSAAAEAFLHEQLPALSGGVAEYVFEPG